jgi:predicted O-methyltransferase YrrM
LAKAAYSEMTQAVDALAYRPAAGETAFYSGPTLGAGALGAAMVADARRVKQAQALIKRLTPDDYSRFMGNYYAAGLKSHGRAWGYADIVTVLLGLADALKPTRYLEIGVRRGRSACAVASRAPDCALALFDMWMPGYAGMENPGPDLVKGELARVGHRGPVEFIDGDSHQTLPAYFTAHPEAAFDIITVDGDHTDEGAAQDLADILPRLKIGGAVVFDDVSHPAHPGLAEVWRDLVAGDRRFSAWTYDEVGFGVGFAIRKY